MNKQQLATDLLIKNCEGIRLVAYLDTSNNWTIGIGLKGVYPNGIPIRKNDSCTEQQAYDWLNEHLSKNVYPYVDNLCAGNKVADKTYAALCSFVYNEGHCGPSIIKAIQNESLEELKEAFKLYNKEKINGVLTYSQGLANRRNIEINYFMESN